MLSHRLADPQRIHFIISGLVGMGRLLMPWLFAALGLALIADAAAYFYRGTGLIQF